MRGIGARLHDRGGPALGAALTAALLLGGGTACARGPHGTPVRLEASGLTVRQSAPVPGHDAGVPRLEWHPEGRTQSAYRVLISDDPGALDVVAAGGLHNRVWDSGLVRSGEFRNVVPSGFRQYPGIPYFWRVRVWDAEGASSKWSEAGHWIATPR